MLVLQQIRNVGWTFVLLQAGSVEQSVMATASSASAVDCCTADSSVLCQRTIVTQSGEPDAVNCTSSIDVQSTDSTAAASAACRAHAETSAIVGHEARRSVHSVALIY